MGELSPVLPRFTEFQLPSPLLINASNPFDEPELLTAIEPGMVV